MTADVIDLTTVSKVKLNLSIADVNSDEILQELITSLSAYVTTFLNRNIKTATYTEKHSGNGRDTLRPREWPITAISSVLIDGVAAQASADDLSNGYTFDDKYIYLLRGSSPAVFTTGVRNISLSYTAGYATVPRDIDRICVEIVSKRYRDRKRIGLTSEGMQGQTTGFSQEDMTRDTMAVLNNYRRVVP